MVKLVVLYKKPADVSAFEQHYKEIHAPLARKFELRANVARPRPTDAENVGQGNFDPLVIGDVDA